MNSLMADGKVCQNDGIETWNQWQTPASLTIRCLPLPSAAQKAFVASLEKRFLTTVNASLR
jgi:hypothetical protein